MSVNKQWSFRNINVITKEVEKKAETKVYGMYNYIDTSNKRVNRTFSKSFKNT